MRAFFKLEVASCRPVFSQVVLSDENVWPYEVLTEPKTRPESRMCIIDVERTICMTRKRRNGNVSSLTGIIERNPLLFQL